MSWHRFLNDSQRKKEREKQEAECSERYERFSGDDLQVKREEVEATLEFLNRDFPDWENQTQSRAYSEIRRLEKERECIILELAKRSESHASRITDEGSKRKGVAPESTNSPIPEQYKQIELGKFCVQVTEEMQRIKYLALSTGRSMAQIEKENPGFAVWKVRNNLTSEDQEIFNRPTRWEATVGYATLVLSKIHGKSTHAITSWKKIYKRAQKNKKTA